MFFIHTYVTIIYLFFGVEKGLVYFLKPQTAVTVQNESKTDSTIFVRLSSFWLLEKCWENMKSQILFLL